MDMSTLMPTKWHLTKNKPCCPCKKKKSLPWLDGTLNTEYRNEFIDKEVPVQKVVPKQELIKSNAPFDGATTYGGDFKQFQTARPNLMKPVDSQHVTGGEFNADSTYKQQFVPKAVPYERVRARPGAPPNTGEFYGNTTYGGDFVPRGVPQPAKLVVRTSHMERPGPFEGESNYKSNFTKMPMAKREPMAARTGGDIMPKGAFDDGTSYRTNYVPKEVGRAVQCRPQDAGPVNQGDWDGTTEYRNQFIDKDVSAAKMVRPDRGGDVLPRGPLDASTTYGGDFKQFATAPAKAMRPVDATHAQNHPFDGTSTYANSFIPKAVPYSRVKAKNAFEPNKAPFEGDTTHKAAFQAYAMVPAHRGGPTRTPRESHPFEGQSSYKSDFTKMPGGPAKMSKPQSDRIATGPFDGTTTYRNDFVEKEIPIPDDCTDCSSCEEEGY